MREARMSDHPIVVLCIDDDTSALQVLEAAAHIAGFEYHGTSDPVKGLEIARELEPDVIISDVMMPGMTGFELCETLKAARETQLIPIVLVTALDARKDRIRGIEAGCDDFLTKPIDRLVLTSRVKSLARLRQVTETLDDAEKVLESLARSVEAKDGTTGAHCDRLVRNGKSFGTFLELSRHDVSALSRAGILHDIGKIGISEAVLMKPGKLNEVEWDEMKRHPAIGADLLAPLITMKRVIPIVRHHHERWDGRGYPDGLRGEDIPYLARCFQLLDAYDALRSERPYKVAFSHQKSCDILKEEREDGRWDPKLLEQFLNFMEVEPPYELD
jgi:putative two-component system response regulator